MHVCGGRGRLRDKLLNCAAVPLTSRSNWDELIGQNLILDKVINPANLGVFTVVCSPLGDEPVIRFRTLLITLGMTASRVQ